LAVFEKRANLVVKSALGDKVTSNGKGPSGPFLYYD